MLMLGFSVATLWGQVSFTDRSILYPGLIYSGAPMGIADMNSDGKDDIIHLDDRLTLKISYQNNPSQVFTQVNYGQLNNGIEWSLCVADVDKNGINDLIAGGQYNNIKLAKGDSQGNFTPSLINNSSIFVQGTNFSDINNDGWIDIFACHDDGDNQKYRNDGSGNFILDNTLINTASPGSDNSGNYSAIWTDYDNDGDLDMYLSKCSQGVFDENDLRRINKLMNNDGNNVFTDVAGSAGLRIGAQTWTTDFADVDNDGDMDAFVNNHGSDCQLFLNNGDGTFTDNTANSGFLPTLAGNVNLQGIQAIFRDFDNDGFVDLLYAGSEHHLFYNDGDGTFTLAANPFGTLPIHSFAIGDLNQDGFLDLYTGNGQGFNSTGTSADDLYTNDGNSNHFIAVQLEGTQSNINGIGARVEIYGTWGIQVREVRSGEGYGIMNTLTQHFGLGSATEIDRIIVRWPSGLTDIVENPNIDQFVKITEAGISNSAPVASFTSTNVVGQAPHVVNFDASASFDPDGDPLSYIWDFGDGNIGDGINSTHTYTTAGVYLARLTVSDGINSSRADTTITIFPTGSCLNELVDFENFETGWGIWNDGGSDATRVQRNWNNPISNVLIRLRDNTSQSVMTTDNLDFSNYSEITVSFTYEANSFDSENEDFWLQISTNGGSTYTTIEEWNLGDEFLNNQIIQESITYTGQLTANTKLRFRCDATADGDQVYIDDITIEGCVPVVNNPPNALISANPITGEAPLIVNLDASGSVDPDGNSLVYTWDLGDGNSSNNVSFGHEYEAPGSYTVLLTVSDGELFDQSSITITVTDPENVYKPGLSVARNWVEVLLEAIRNDYARPTVHARNLHHITAAMFDAWSAYENTALQYYLGNVINGFDIPFEGVPPVQDVKAAQEKAMSYAAYRLIQHRFAGSPGQEYISYLAEQLMAGLGYATNIAGTNYTDGDPAELGNYIAGKIIVYGFQDQSNEAGGYANTYYNPVNEFMVIADPGNPNLTDPNGWQPLAFDVFVDQGGNVIEANIPDFLSPEWGNVAPFALRSGDMDILPGFNGGTYQVYHNPGFPPLLGSTGDNIYKWAFSMVPIWGAHLDPSDGVIWDISPGAMGNTPVSSYPASFNEYNQFYDFLNGGSIGTGRSLNPKTNAAYNSQFVPRGDYARVLAEFWADGPDSETPPGHWFTLLNYVTDHLEFVPKWKGEGAILTDLEWDIKSFFTLGGTVHDAAISAWSVKGYYDYIRPISAIRYMADQGQSSYPNADNYSVNGISLVPGKIEMVQTGDPLAGSNNEHVGKIKLRTWKGPNYILDPETSFAGVDWILAEEWWPYQRPTFVTPPFAGYVSGHSTFSRAAAEVMTFMTGDEYFPGGMGEFLCKRNEFLEFEDGPSVDVTLQWATYRDASDECSLSRVWGGIHPVIDDIPGRLIGIEVGNDAFVFSDSIFSAAPSTRFRLKLALEGPYDASSGLMNDLLRSEDKLGTTDPYGFGANANAELFDEEGDNAPVDWIFVELRNDTDPDQLIASQALLLQRDGDVMMPNGSIVIQFPDVAPGDYHLIVGHMNHLPMAANGPIDFKQVPQIDLSNAAIPVYGPQGEPGRIIGNTRLLLAGDANQDGAVNAVDKNDHWRLENGQPYIYGNMKADFNLDGAINSVDKNAHWRINNSRLSQLP